VAVELEPGGARRRVRMLPADGRDQTLRAAEAGGWRAFEPPLPEVLWACCRRWPGLMVDAGANSGYYALLALAAHRRNRAVCFEPDARVAPLLRGNMAVNGWRRRGQVRAEALSDHVGQGELYLPFDNHGLVETSSSLERGFKARHGGVRMVALTTLDAALGPSARPSMIKIDVEGHEGRVLAGARAVLARARPLIAVELLMEAEFDFLNELFRAQGYGSVRLHAEGLTAEPELAFDMAAWNHLLIPDEKRSQFEALMRSRGLLG